MKLKFWQKTILAVANLICPSKIYGKENLPEGASVIVSNHFSVIECIHYLNISKDRPFFLAKKEIFKNKLYSKFFTSFGAIPIDRNKLDVKAMLSAIKVLKEGEKLIIFPEGTRNRTGTDELQDVKGGACVFAVRTKSPIIPVMLLKKPRLFRKTKIIIGRPFELCEFYDKKLTNDDIEVMDNIMRERMIAEHKKLKEMVSK